MNQTPKLSFVLTAISLISAILVLVFTQLDTIGSRGIYTYPVLGGLYELLWLPLLSALCFIPIVLLVFAWRKK